MSSFQVLAEWLSSAGNAVCFTGAGISTESGIPDFRSPGGVWSRTQPVLFDDYVRSTDSRNEYWRQKAETHDEIMRARPNIAHHVLADWETRERLRGVITQNIDGLHQLAGNRHVLELHGTSREVTCLDCEFRADADSMVAEFRGTGTVPACPTCGGIMKHATVSFGQSLPADVLRTALAWSQECELFLVLGSSLVVHPAATLPEVAARGGAKLVIINRDETPLDALADMVIRDSIGRTMHAWDQAVQRS